MIAADYQAVSRGLEAVGDAHLRRAMLKRQLQRDEEDAELRRAMLKLQQQEASDRTLDRQDATAVRREGLTLHQEGIKKQMEAAAWAQDPNNPANQERAARVNLLKAQTTATSAKPATPLQGQIQTADEFSEAMAAALQDNQRALAAAQAGDPNGQTLALKAQLKLSALQAMGQQFMKGAKAEPEVDVEIAGPIDEATGKSTAKARIKVPQSQWNENHPLWHQVMKPAAAAAKPALSTQDQQAAAWAKANPQDPRAAKILQRLNLLQ